MEDKRLNFNRPLLSVRRFSSTVASQKDTRRKNEVVSPSPSYKSELQSGPLRNAGSVPFVWEQSPGRPKYKSKTQKHARVLVPKPPPGRFLKPNQQDSSGSASVFQRQENLTKFKSSKEQPRLKDDGDLNGYMDALDTLPRHDTNINQPGTRFPTRGNASAAEVPREVKKVNKANEKPQIAYGPNFLEFAGNDNTEEDIDFDYDAHENTFNKVCGLLPHFCLKGSIGLLNPIPGLTVRSSLPTSSTNGTRAGHSSAISQPARVAVYEHRALDNNQKGQHVLNNESMEVTNEKNLRKIQVSGLHDRLQDRGISSDLTKPPPPSVFERKEADLHKKGLTSFKELLAADQKKVDLHNPTIEKTVYVDTIHKVNSLNLQSDFNEDDVVIFKISHIPTESDLLADGSKQDKETKTLIGFGKEENFSGKSCFELPAPPPLPKSPSDSWLWRTLPSVSSKASSLHSNPKYPAKLDDDNAIQLGNPKGLLLPIPET